MPAFFSTPQEPATFDQQLDLPSNRGRSNVCARFYWPRNGSIPSKITIYKSDFFPAETFYTSKCRVAVKIAVDFYSYGYKEYFTCCYGCGKFFIDLPRHAEPKPTEGSIPKAVVLDRPSEATTLNPKSMRNGAACVEPPLDSALKSATTIVHEYSCQTKSGDHEDLPPTPPPSPPMAAEPITPKKDQNRNAKALNKTLERQVGDIEINCKGCEVRQTYHKCIRGQALYCHTCQRWIYSDGFWIKKSRRKVTHVVRECEKSCGQDHWVLKACIPKSEDKSEITPKSEIQS